MKKVYEIFEYLCELAPLELQLDFDNAGFLVGHRNALVSDALVALDITDDVIEEALALGAELIVSHHPVIWDPIKALTDCEPNSRALRLAENHLAAICMHTNLDIAQGGVNDVLMARLGGCVEDKFESSGCGRIGRLAEPLAFAQFLHNCKEALHANGLRYYDAGRPVSRLAVMGGAGADMIEDAWRAGCDTYVTSDIKYHQFQKAVDFHINLIDADHFCTENPVMDTVTQRLCKRFPDVNFILSKRHKQLISFY
ncbi:MAG: Nif3-like dinuclear metal center hexameric protein [Oscillospiraceae bacterium]|nr:Nif3-like dinuclear metal center hexameric protein [Oscillospiraceae bacterium]